MEEREDTKLPRVGGKTLDACCVGYCYVCHELIFSDDNVGHKDSIRWFIYCPDCGKLLVW